MLGDVAAELAIRSKEYGVMQLGYAPEQATRIAKAILPGMLFYDSLRPARFSVNGRTLIDDAVDSFVALLTNGKVTGDGIGPLRDLLSEFPYLGPPHNSEVIDVAPSLLGGELEVIL